jgi:hypothetical protein
MKGITGNLRMDFRRAFLSPAFILAAAGMAAVLLLNAANEIKIDYSNCSVLYLSDVMDSNEFYFLAMILSAVPFAASFCSDWNNQFIRPSCIRSGPRQYCASKIIVCALSGGAVVALGHIIAYAVLMPCFPLFGVHEDLHNYISNYPAIKVLLEGRHFLMFLLFKLIFQFGFYAFLAVLAFLLSTFIPNIFVVLASPLLAYFFLNNLGLELHIPVWLDFDCISGGRCSLYNTAVSVIYAVAFFTALCTMMGIAAGINVKRWLQHA